MVTDVAEAEPELRRRRKRRHVSSSRRNAFLPSRLRLTLAWAARIVGPAERPLAIMTLALGLACFGSFWLWPNGVLFPQAIQGGPFDSAFGQSRPDSGFSAFAQMFAAGPLASFSGLGRAIFTAEIIFAAALVVTCTIRRSYSLAQGLIPWIPFIASALISTLTAMWPGYSSSVFANWCLFVMSSLGIGVILGRILAQKLIGGLAAAAVLASLLAIWLYPQVAVDGPPSIGSARQWLRPGWRSARWSPAWMSRGAPSTRTSP